MTTTTREYLTREEITECLRLYREKDDRSKWQAGDVCVGWLASVEHGSRMSELASLAEASGYTYAGLRERHDCSAYWPKPKRLWTDGVIGWSHYNRARRGVDLNEACARMEHAEDNGLTVTAFDKWLKWERSNISTAPAPLPAAVQTVASAVADLRDRTDLPPMAKPIVAAMFDAAYKLMAVCDAFKQTTEER